MRNFNFPDANIQGDANISAANIAGVRPSFDETEILLVEEPARDDVSLSSFHSNVDELEDSSNNTAKLAGAALVGLLLVGGGLYAYESSSANHAPSAARENVALIPAAPKAPASETASQQPIAPAATPDENTPAPAAIAPVSSPKSARSTRSGVASASPAPSQQDTAINQPMTLTPQSAPPAEAAANASPAQPQTAMQQPITAPNVSGQTGQPTPEVANNADAGSASAALPSSPVTVQPDVTPPASDAAAPAPAQ